MASPRATFFKFLGQINATKQNRRAWAGAIACLNVEGIHKDRVKEKATELLAVINRLGEVREDDVPNAAEINASGAASFQFFPRDGVHDWVRESQDFTGAIILVKRDDGAWEFSQSTMAGISELYRDLDQLVAFTEGIRELIRNHPITRKEGYVVHLNDFGGSSLNILMQVFFMTSDWGVELAERERLLSDVMKLADQLGVQFAFPTQTLHLHRQEGVSVHKPSPLPSESAHDASTQLGHDTAKDVLNGQAWYKNPQIADEGSAG